MTKREDQTILVSVGGGLLLLLTGILAYVLSDFASPTALIPAVFGVMIVILGVMAQKPDHRNRSILGIGLLALLVVLGSLMRISDVFALLAGDEVDSVVATMSQGVSIVIGLAIVLVTAHFAREHA